MQNTNSQDVGHGILGFYCDGVKKIYDSENFIYTLDWGRKASLDSLLELQRYKKNDFNSVGLECIVHINKKYIDYKNLDTKELCKKL